MLDMGRELEEGECEAFRVEMTVEEGDEQDDQSGEWMKYKKVANKTKPVGSPTGSLQQ